MGARRVRRQPFVAHRLPLLVQEAIQKVVEVLGLLIWLKIALAHVQVVEGARGRTRRRSPFKLLCILALRRLRLVLEDDLLWLDDLRRRIALEDVGRGCVTVHRSEEDLPLVVFNVVVYVEIRRREHLGDVERD